MQSKAKDVSAYIQEAAAERQPYLAKLLELCLEVLAGYEEGMEYGMAGYKKDGVGEVGFFLVPTFHVGTPAATLCVPFFPLTLCWARPGNRRCVSLR